MTTPLRGTDAQPIAQRFAEFHAANPHVYRELLKLARQARDDGATKIGMKMLWEVMRWNRRLYVATTSTDSYRLNNDYTSYYSRLLARNDPSLAGLFETRGDVELPAAVLGPAQTSLDVAA